MDRKPPKVTTIAGDAALKFDPSDTAAIQAAMARIATDDGLRRDLTEAGPRQAAKYSWRETAEITLSALKS